FLSFPFLAQGGAPAWPSRPVVLVVPYVPGGPSDLLARALAGPLQAATGQPVVVENRTGANGIVAAQHVMRQAPDGQTLFVAASGLLTVTPLITARPPFDPVQDFTPLTIAISAPNLLVVHPSVPVATLPELIAWLKANPGRASYGSSGIGSSEHLGMELFKLRTGTEATHVPYPGGGAAVTDLVGGTLQLSMLNVATVAQHVLGGRLRAIAVGGAARHPLLPEVPTFPEAGLPGFSSGSWHSIVAPAGMPPALQARVQAVLREALRSPEIAARLAATGFAVEATDGATLKALVEADLVRWREVVRAAAIPVN
ncbi:Bug family tripartite tricarboxylate transporter substrate binding protein, partial [Falsiroseomonas oryzae]|uniref:Bug family tripartite tricarboxylate transporter substrate binding protein n=1 Tax=Falsiroseomonas oryzae TaxID=2766473 RepID=UPI0022EB1F36